MAARSENDLVINIRKATSIGKRHVPLVSLLVLLYSLCGRGNRSQTYAIPKHQKRFAEKAYALTGKHVRACIVYTWDHKSSQSFWAGMKVYVMKHKPTTVQVS